MNAPHDENWVERARALLDRSTDSLDAATVSRLHRARQAALAQRRDISRRWVLGAGIAATAALMLGIGIGLYRSDATDRPVPIAPQADALQPDDIDVLTGDDDALDLYENLDFYAWLDAQEGGSSG
jgi:hypothetical protein